MKISIIVPVYNVEEYIAKCIQSLLNQTYTNFEALIIDDGSPDQSIAIAKKLVGNDPRFIFITKKNGGASSARNLGLDYASGEYICFLDPDDAYSNYFLEKMIFTAQQSEADIIICGVIGYSSSKKEIFRIKSNINTYYKKKDLLLCFKESITVGMTDKLYKSNIFKDIRFNSSRRSFEDIPIAPKALYNRKIALCDDYLYYQNITPGSLSRTISDNFFIDRKNSVLEAIDFFLLETNSCSNKEKKSYSNFYYLTVMVLWSVSILTHYSGNYPKDIKRLMEIISPKVFTYKNIINSSKYSITNFLKLLIIKLSPNIYKKLVTMKHK